MMGVDEEHSKPPGGDTAPGAGQPEITDAEARHLEGHFSNPGGRVFVITTPSQVDRGALMSRYSRSTKSMRRVFLDEFLNNPNRGEEFYKRVLMEYGDDSVAELGTAQVGIEGISNVAVRTIEDRRIGLSFLEKSSRYVSWAAKRDGRYAYYRGPDISESIHEKIYEEACDFSFDTYVHCIPTVRAYLEETYPLKDFLFRDSRDSTEKPFSKLTIESDIKMAERAYRNAAKSMVFDLLRGLLPASTLTNLGITGNGRAFEYLISILKSSRLDEEKKIGEDLTKELEATMGPFIRRAKEKYGRRLEEFLTNLRQASEPPMLDSTPVTKSMVSLASYDKPQDAMNMVVAGLLYENSGQTFGNLLACAKDMPHEKKSALVSRFAALRNNRRQRPPRAFEMASYTFDMVTNFGMFRDMHRHRILTLQRQLLDAKHGFEMPPELEAAGCSGEFAECMKRSRAAYDTMAVTDPVMAQYAVNFAYLYRYVIRVNLRELCHMVELRTLPQGHPDYREVARLMFDRVSGVHPDLSRIIKFADTGVYFMGRIASEKRTLSKLLGTGPSTAPSTAEK